LDWETEVVDVIVGVGDTEGVTETDDVTLVEEDTEMVGVTEGVGLMLTTDTSLLLLPTMTEPSIVMTGELLMSLPTDNAHNTAPVLPSTLTTLPLLTPTYNRLLVSTLPPDRTSTPSDNDQIGDPDVV
jgi:hypothetical protein